MAEISKNNAFVQFNAAVEFVQNLSMENNTKQQPNHKKFPLGIHELLSLYALYKQATLGDCNDPKPRFYNVKAKAKWEAWTAKRGLSKEEAMKQYVQELLGAALKFEPSPERDSLLRLLDSSPLSSTPSPQNSLSDEGALSNQIATQVLETLPDVEQGNIMNAQEDLNGVTHSQPPSLLAEENEDNAVKHSTSTNNVNWDFSSTFTSEFIRVNQELSIQLQELENKLHKVNHDLHNGNKVLGQLKPPTVQATQSYSGLYKGAIVIGWPLLLVFCLERFLG